MKPDINRQEDFEDKILYLHCFLLNKYSSGNNANFVQILINHYKELFFFKYK